MTISKEDVLNALKHVEDPDLKKDLVTLNMIEEVAVDGNKVSFTVRLTTPACPLKEKIKNDCVNAIHEHIGADVTTDITMTASVTSHRNPNINVLPSVKNIICVASGKGGVGKSTVAVNLAIALSKQGAKVGIIDADIYGPSIPTMLGIRGKRPSVRLIKEKHYIEPIEVYGIKVLSMGMLVDERQAIVWRGPMVTSALRQFVTDCLWGRLDYLILDMPPGTGDVHLTMIQTVNVTGAVIVTTPQEVALSDARKGLAMFRLDTVNVPVLGIVENMSYFTPAELPDNKYYIFGKDGGKKFAEEYELPLLGELPIVQSIREGGDDGTPIALRDSEIDLSSRAFEDLATNVARQIAIKNAKAGVTVSAEVGEEE
ncbi:MAG: family ATP-binding protein [Bacteroidetes bacterium]|nr:family ATP-binding protein [Bacteroidota bacterium]